MTQQEIDELREMVNEIRGLKPVTESQRLNFYAGLDFAAGKLKAWLDRKEAEMVRNVKYAGDRLP